MKCGIGVKPVKVNAYSFLANFATRYLLFRASYLAVSPECRHQTAQYAPDSAYLWHHTTMRKNRFRLPDTSADIIENMDQP